MVHIPKAAPVPDVKQVPNKIAELETRIHKLEAALDAKERQFNEQAQTVVLITDDLQRLKAGLKDVLVKLGGEIPEWLQVDLPTPAPTNVTAPE